MDLVERIIWLCIGGFAGYTLARIVDYLRAINTKVERVEKREEEVLEIVKNSRPKDERGFMRFPLVADVGFVIVLIIVVWGAFSANSAAKETRQLAEETEKISTCNQEYLKSQAEFLAVLLQEDPPSTQAEQEAALRKYYALLNAYANNQNGSEFETSVPDSVKICIQDAKEKEDE